MEELERIIFGSGHTGELKSFLNRGYKFDISEMYMQRPEQYEKIRTVYDANSVNFDDNLRYDNLFINNHSFTKIQSGVFPPPKESPAYCKKIIETEFTKVVNTTYIFKKNTELSRRLQILVNNTINILIDKYKETNNLRNDDVIFYYKGGTTFSIHSNIVMSDISANTNKQYDNFVKSVVMKLRDCLEKSDSDYSLVINPRLGNFTQVYKDCNKIIYACLLYVRNEIFSHKDFFNNRELQNLLSRDELNHIAHDINKEIIANCSDKTQIRNIKIFDINHPNIDKLTDKMITSFSAQSVDLKDFNAQLNNTDITKWIYLGYNDSNQFGDSNFCLQRLKISFLCEQGNKIKCYRGELVDISIPKITDGHLNEMYHTGISKFIISHSFDVLYPIKKRESSSFDWVDDFEVNPTMRRGSQIPYTRSESSSAEDSQKINIFSLEGLFLDLCGMLVADDKFPWEFAKYYKRYKRAYLLIMFLLCLNINTDCAKFFECVNTVNIIFSGDIEEKRLNVRLLGSKIDAKLMEILNTLFIKYIDSIARVERLNLNDANYLKFKSEITLITQNPYSIVESETAKFDDFDFVDDEEDLYLYDDYDMIDEVLGLTGGNTEKKYAKYVIKNKNIH
jgi:hypothetical protein